MPEVKTETGKGSARYSLYWTWASAAMSCHAALEEVGVEYSLRFIDFEKPWPDDYQTINPHKKVPTLIDDNPMGTPAGDAAGAGQPVVIYQSAAILLYLAENHPEFGLMPPAGHARRAACYQWLFFMAETLQPAYMTYFYPERYTMNESGQTAIQEKAIQWIDELWGCIDTQIGSKPFVLGEGLSVCDFFMLPMAYWSRDGSDFKTLKTHTNVTNTLNELFRRPSVAQMIARHCE